MFRKVLDAIKKTVCSKKNTASFRVDGEPSKQLRLVFQNGKTQYKPM